MHRNFSMAAVSLVATAAVVTGVATVGHAAAASHGDSGRTGTIAFVRLGPGPDFGGGLFVVHPDGSGLRRLTGPATSVYWYAWSPDGRRIAYIDARGSLWLVHPDGTGSRLLLPTSHLSSAQLSWSPDGKAIAIISPGPKTSPGSAASTKIGLYVVPVDGAPPVALPGGRHVGWDVAWSPRGNEIAYNNGGTFVIRPDGTGRRRVSPPGSGDSIRWSADGAQLAFNVLIHRSNGSAERYRAFGVVDADGTNFHVVTEHAYNEYGVAWSPHGRRLLYGRGDRQGIYVIGADGRNNRRVTRDAPPQAGWGALAWSPTGGSIVYSTGGTDNSDLYVIGVDGRDKVRLTNTPDDDIDPSWVAR